MSPSTLVDTDDAIAISGSAVSRQLESRKHRSSLELTAPMWSAAGARSIKA